MSVCFSSNARDDYLFWQKTDRRTLKRVDQLIKATLREPFDGPAKPEPLRHGLAGYWSRRIDYEHRMVYKIVDGTLVIAQLRYHY
ncbi:Txe/YoeB family addiction module toxin [Spiribacter vilamensis]|uniref:Putative mRNA interferase YoeB n=1 Tax=Spiribacter vilamensis TaxID=531306 RepID=A0A4Q8D2T3_9GAMM|nr:Txe/YoeB family addiction module toxin [Spiribacter vilamensis]RZU99630.1 toxin YoeB [Spiribacter vilamensis]TVO61412.1 Txe/YoeB family addiction module toxin [Spiribacter vilamensis]